MAANGLTVQISVVFLAAATVGLLSYVSMQSKTDYRGWRQVKAGAMHWTGLLLGTALTILFTYVLLFVGSSRADAERQMTILFWLTMAFGIGTIIAGLAIGSITAQALRWRGQKIMYTGRVGPETRTFQDLERLSSSLWGRTSVWLKDGSAIKVDPNATGAHEFIEAVADHLDASARISKRDDFEQDGS